MIRLADEYANKIIQGNALDVLKGMPGECVDMVITSPPYWALRNYGTNPQIWDGDVECDHEFSLEKRKPLNLQSGNPEFQRKWREQASNIKTTTGCFCKNCGSWRGELGLEPTFELYIKHLCDIFDEIGRVLKNEGTCWVNIGDTYHNATRWTNKEQLPQTISSGNNRDFKTGKRLDQGLPEKCFCMIPSRFAIEMINRGWILRNEIIWHKPNCMPSSANDRFTVDFEKIFFFTKARKYYFEQQFEKMSPSSFDRLSQDKENQNGSLRAHGLAKINGPMKAVGDFTVGRNKRCVWQVSTKFFSEAHFAVFPETLVETPIKAGCPEGGVVLDPFCGSGTTPLVAHRLRRKFIGIELNPKYVEMAQKRLEPELSQLRLF